MPAAKVIDANRNCELGMPVRPEVWVEVWIVSTVDWPALPGITVVGLKEAVAPGGSPEADIVTTPLKVSPLGITLTEAFAESPGVTVRVCGAVTVKAGATRTVKARGDDVEVAKTVFPE